MNYEFMTDPKPPFFLITAFRRYFRFTFTRGQGVIKSNTRPTPAPSSAARLRPKSPIKLPTQENKSPPKRVASPAKELLSSPKRIAAANISSILGARQRQDDIEICTYEHPSGTLYQLYHPIKEVHKEGS